MNENSNPLHRPLAVGDIVIVARGEEYGGLTGQITEVRRLGSPEHDTGNRTDDIIVDLSILDYSDGMKDEITALMNELGYEVDSYDDVSIDSVILAPEDLIQINDDELTRHHVELATSLESACEIGEKLSAQHFDEIYKVFTARVEKNYADYEHEMLGFGAREIFDMAARIHAVSDAHSYLTVYHNFSEEELRFYLQFQNPLDIVAQAWHERNIDVGDVSFTTDFLWERRDKVTQENSLVRDTPSEPERLEMPEPAEPATPLDRLCEKMKTEYEGFIGDMKLKPAGDILEAAYEKVFKEDLLLTVETENLNDEQIAALLTLETPLADLYWNWLDTDVSYMDMLRDSVDEYADAVIKELKAEQAKTEPAQEPEKPKQQPPASKQPPSLLGEVREAAREVEARKAAQTALTPTKSTIKKENEL